MKFALCIVSFDTIDDGILSLFRVFIKNNILILRWIDLLDEVEMGLLDHMTNVKLA